MFTTKAIKNLLTLGTWPMSNEGCLYIKCVAMSVIALIGSHMQPITCTYLALGLYPVSIFSIKIYEEKRVEKALLGRH